MQSDGVSETPPRRVPEMPETGLSDDDLPDPVLIEKIWRVMSRWAVPVMMSLAYVFLAATSEVDTTGKLWMGVGLVFVLVVWGLFRRLADSAALARALSVGDVGKLELIAVRGATRKKTSARFVVAGALAHTLRGDFPAARAALDAGLGGQVVPAELVALTAVVQIAARTELGEPVEAVRGFVVASPRTPALAWLADGIVAWRAGQLDVARGELTRVIDDIRAGGAARAIAHVYAARVADANGEPAEAVRHRRDAAALATPGARWLRPG